jgi:uroporphyrinogen-III synthase
LRKLLLLRPEPGLSTSVERARALGLDVVACPLFRIEAVEWAAPDPAEFDGLLLTSANAVRSGGAGLQRLLPLRVHAVGAATADVARDAGFRVESVGTSDVADLLGELDGSLRLLHLAGEDRRELPEGHLVKQITVYRSAAIGEPDLPALEGMVVAVHSPRAGARLADLAGERSTTSIAAISSAAATACGEGWERVEAAGQPTDSSLLALAARLCHTSSPK